MVTESDASLLKKAEVLINRIEDAIIVILLLLMVLLAVFQIISRNLFGVGYSWTEMLIRVLVLWIGLLGAMAASRQGDHVSIDLFSRFLPQRMRLFSDMIGRLFTVLVCLLISWHGFRFVAMEYEYGGLAFAWVPLWLCQLIIPIGFAVIGIRYLVLTLQSGAQFLKLKS